MSFPQWDPEAVDPLSKERGVCMEKDCDVRKVFNELQACQTRVENKPYTAETCHQETMDLTMAVDKCVGRKAFDRLR